MTDLLISAAKRLGVPVEASAGPGGIAPTLNIWARWPRHPYEVAQDVLNHIIRTEVEASVTPVGGTPLWRARHGRWTHIGRFEDAVAHLASHVAETPVADLRAEDAPEPARAVAARRTAVSGFAASRSGLLP
jgi:hypothetical protein